MRFNPTPEQLAEARRMYTGGRFNQHTIDHRKQLTGHLAEIVFRDWLNSEWLEHEYVANEMGPCDFIIGRRGIDVKAKRRKKQINHPDFETHVEFRIKGEESCDHYLFASVLVPEGSKDAVAVEFVGWMPRVNYWAHPELEVVEVNQKTGDDFKEKAKAGKLAHRYLRPIRELRDRIETHLYQVAFGEV